MRKAILITGAASGIGRETARLFASKRWLVGAFDLNREGLTALQNEIGEEKCHISVCDITNPEEYKKEIEIFMEKSEERLDALFNCAGILHMGKDEEISLEKKLKTIDVNLKGVIIGIHLSLPYLKKGNNPAIISMSSNAAIYGVPELAVYSASKFGVRALTEALNIELEKYGILVCDIMAPYVDTPMINDTEKKAHSIDKTGVAMTAEEVAKIVFRALSGRKAHRFAHYSTGILSLLQRILPAFLIRPLVKYLTYKE